MSLAREMTVPRGSLVMLLFASVLVMALEFGFSEMIKDFSVEKECTCAFKEYSERDNRFALKFNCEGKEGHSTDADLISKYLKNPQSFSSVRVCPVRVGESCPEKVAVTSATDSAHRPSQS